ncbi:sigma-70 family RNA polymerase sigma factor [Xanthobacter oligotrophicus]|uniref:sigma-70 family RNA polymerase sigma factor n=1 Tax=Xanthobacter oligotrophicus TaxID=2607286 RepID=UPI001E4DA0AD|nr:sigma-70 family RNA polymerase sigma factor [Xanthobacter oligotrophicus]MCG5237832.1 sigma-70 family RNA polymerase sigma factor [Xanthobacter oligotrophicus]
MLATGSGYAPWYPSGEAGGTGAFFVRPGEWRAFVLGLAALVRGVACIRSARAHPMAELSARHGHAAPAADRGLDAAGAARFDALILPHLDAAYNLARYLSRDPDAAQDIVQDAFLRAYRSFADFRGLSPRAWLLAIVRNCHATWRMQRRRAPQAAPLPHGEGEEPDDATALLVDGDTPESLLLRRTEAEAVRALLEHLPEPLREALVLRELDELSYREIAEVAGVPVGTVMSRLSRARRLFADLWSRATPGGEATP